MSINETDQEAAREMRDNLKVVRELVQLSRWRMTELTLEDHSRSFGAAIAECLSAEIALAVADATLAEIEANGAASV